MSRTLTGIVATTLLAAGLPLLWAAPQENRSATKAETETYQVDNVHACVLFKIKHLGVADFYGRFNTITGTFRFNADRPSENALDIRVPVKDIDTNNSKRDEHLRSADFFNVEKYPDVRFVARKFTPAGEHKFEVTGDLTLHGVTKPLTITLERSKSAEDPWGNTRVGIATEFTIKRTDYGMTTMVGALGDEVTLIVSLEGIRQ